VSVSLILCGFGPVERKPARTKAQQNENMCPIRSKEAFVLTGRPHIVYVP